MTSLIVMKKENYLGYHNDLVKKTLISMSIEKALLEIGKETYDEVAHELYKKYHSCFQDCCEHPEYLSEILTQLCGNTGKVVVDSIKKQLEEFSDHGQITRVLEVISK